ncbi:hypothetical protein B0H14DRAFT_2796043 [Mycena olivaceomarginata]|nr:hypothetical protein B0H14DRAFT_2796043 [Mycena olivaceomarginata]
MPAYQQLMHALLRVYVGVPVAIHLLWHTPHAERVDCTTRLPASPMLAHECARRTQLCGLEARYPVVPRASCNDKSKHLARLFLTPCLPARRTCLYPHHSAEFLPIFIYTPDAPPQLLHLAFPPPPCAHLRRRQHLRAPRHVRMRRPGPLILRLFHHQVLAFVRVVLAQLRTAWGGDGER